MRILLVGEFSRLHNSLKEGLLNLGHEVTIIGSGDQFKKYPVDINVDSQLFNKNPLLFVRKVIHRFTKIDIAQIEIYFRIKNKLPLLKGFDVVQLINEDAFFIHPNLQIPLLKYLFYNNSKSFLLSCGDDYISINHYLNKNIKYSILTPYLENKDLQDNYRYSLKYVTKPFKKLHHFIYNNIIGTISSDLDYHIPLKEHKKYIGLIPNPINVDKIKFTEPIILDKVYIFMGINRPNYFKKGIRFFEEALEIISKKYGDKVLIHKTENLPYDEYIKAFTQSHIVLDQVYAFDQGYNALEAMAMGKVVFTGADQAWFEQYQLKEDTVVINALPDVEKIVNKLSWLIENPKQLIDISKNARWFIEKEHHYINIANRYLETWQNHA